MARMSTVQIETSSTLVPGPEVAVRGGVAITTGAAATGVGTGSAALTGASGSEVASGLSSN